MKIIKGNLTLSAMPAGAYAPGRATQAGQEMSQTKNDTLVLQVGGWAWG
jgi:hypothetical protein